MPDNLSPEETPIAHVHIGPENLHYIDVDGDNLLIETPSVYHPEHSLNILALATYGKGEKPEDGHVKPVAMNPQVAGIIGTFLVQWSERRLRAAIAERN